MTVGKGMFMSNALLYDSDVEEREEEEEWR